LIPHRLAHLDKTEPGRNPDKYKVPERVADYYGRKWRGLESDALWAAREIQNVSGEFSGGWTPYLDKVHDAGGWERYARAHRTRFVATFASKLPLPADVIPLVVDFWAHVGMY